MVGTRARANSLLSWLSIRAFVLTSTVAAGVATCVAVGALATGCATTEPYTWINDMQVSQDAAGDVVIHDGDTVTVRVFNQDPLSTKEKVRPDGKIVIPAVGEIMVRGKRPAALGKEIEEKLKSVLQAPSVAISIEQNTQMTVSVVGEVKNAGNFPLEPTANVLTALAAAGGLTDYADSDKIYVIRKGMTPTQRVRFTFSKLRGADAKSIGFTLRSGDVVVVE